jgi:hypothetical protein
MDRIDNCFAWNDLHWQLTEAEFSQQKEWNEALETYCDDIWLRQELSLMKAVARKKLQPTMCLVQTVLQ